MSARRPLEPAPDRPRLVAAAIGRHLLADLYGVPSQLLRDPPALAEAFHAALELAGFTILKRWTHRFPGPHCGATGIALLSESHASFHTYPEYDYIAVDIFSCGPVEPQAALDRLIATLRPERIEISRHDRGQLVEDLRDG